MEAQLERTHQGGSDRRPDGSALVHGHRQRQRRQDGDRRHQRRRRPARAGRSSCTSRTARPTDSAAEAKAAKLVQQDQVDVIFGGIYSSTRQAIKGPAVVDGKTLYIYPEQYEGQECDPLIFCTGPVPAQQVEPLIPWLMEQTGAKKFYLPSADYIWPHVLNEKVREVVDGERRRDRRRGVLPPRSHRLRRDRRARSCPAARRWCSTRSFRPGSRRSSSSSTTPASRSGAGSIVCTYFDENFLNLVPAEQVEGLYSCLDYYQDVERSVQRGAARPVRRALPGQRQVHRRQRVLGHVPRPEALGGRREGGGLARAGRRASRRWTTRRSPRGRAGRPRWCPASTTFG